MVIDENFYIWSCLFLLFYIFIVFNFCYVIYLLLNEKFNMLFKNVIILYIWVCF